MTRLTKRQATSSSTITPATRIRDVTGVYLREVEERGRAPRTVQGYQETVENHVLRARGGVGDLRLSECTTGRLERYLQGITRDHGAASAKIARTVLTGVLAVAARHEAITGNPLRETSPTPVARKEVRAISPAEVRTLRRKLREWQHAPVPNGRYSWPHDLLDLIDVLLATGCRISEALALRCGTWTSTPAA
ncbi:hypothetical protein ACHMXD_09075 [Micrococcus luteus]